MNGLSLFLAALIIANALLLPLRRVQQWRSPAPVGNGGVSGLWYFTSDIIFVFRISYFVKAMSFLPYLCLSSYSRDLFYT